MSVFVSKTTRLTLIENFLSFFWDKAIFFCLLVQNLHGRQKPINPVLMGFLLLHLFKFTHGNDHRVRATVFLDNHWLML